MPARSKSQRRAMSIAAHDPRKLYKRNRGLLGMSLEQLAHFASTKEQGFPMRAKGKKR